MKRFSRIASLFVLLSFPVPPAHPAQAAQRSRGRLFPPLNLGVLEGADREQWNKPDQIMDALRIADGSTVGEIGAGGGWFTMHLARRVRQNGVVYAEDVQPEMIEVINRRVQRENLTNVKTVLGTTRDSRLPHGLDAILINGAYNEMENPVAVLKDAAESLKPQGRIAIVDYSPGAGGPGPEAEQRVSTDTVIKGATAAGLRVISQEPVPPFMFMVVLGKPSLRPSK
jgi:predicted methyltransferase